MVASRFGGQAYLGVIFIHKRFQGDNFYSGLRPHELRPNYGRHLCVLYRVQGRCRRRYKNS